MIDYSVSPLVVSRWVSLPFPLFLFFSISNLRFPPACSLARSSFYFFSQARYSRFFAGKKCVLRDTPRFDASEIASIDPEDYAAERDGTSFGPDLRPPNERASCADEKLIGVQHTSFVAERSVATFRLKYR